MKSVLYI